MVCTFNGEVYGGSTMAYEGGLRWRVCGINDGSKHMMFNERRKRERDRGVERQTKEDGEKD